MGDIVKVKIEENRFVLRSKVSENPKFVQHMDYYVAMYLDNFVRFEKSKLRKAGFWSKIEKLQKILNSFKMADIVKVEIEKNSFGSEI